MGLGNYGDGNGSRGLPTWVFPLLSLVVAVFVPLITVSSFGGRYTEKVDNLEKSFAARLDQLAASGAERSNALSARLNSQEEGVRAAAVLSARQDQRLVSIEQAIVAGRTQRDQQLSDLSRQIGDLRDQLNGNQIAMAKIEGLLSRLLGMQGDQPERAGSPRPGGR